MSVVSNFSLIHYGAHQHTAVQFAEDSVPSELQTGLSCVYYNLLVYHALVTLARYLRFLEIGLTRADYR